MTPVFASRLRPVGKAGVTDQTSGGVALATCRVVSYGLLTKASVREDVVIAIFSFPLRLSSGLNSAVNTSRSLLNAVSENAPASPAMAQTPNKLTVLSAALAPVRNPPRMIRYTRNAAPAPSNG